jgi:hypothetical protein
LIVYLSNFGRCEPVNSMNLDHGFSNAGWYSTTHLDADTVLSWNQYALEAIQASGSTPLYASRALAMESIAVFDVLKAIDNTPAYLVDINAPAAISATAAVAAAAHGILTYTFPTLTAVFDSHLSQTLAGVPDGKRESAGAALGEAVADALIALRAADGWDATVTYAGGADAGEWRPTQPGFLPALSPQWGSVIPFALASGDQFRPQGPPDLTSAEYTAAFEDAKRLGSATSPERTDDQTEIARFWADGSGSYTPPGHWNQIATDVAETMDLSAREVAFLLAELNVALADAGIAAWDAKYTYQAVEEVTWARRRSRSRRCYG